MPPTADPSQDPLRSLLRRSHLLAPDQLAVVVAEHARLLGVQETVIYLVDYEQLALHPLEGHGVPQRQELTVEGSVAGRAYRRAEVIHSPTTDGHARLWVPLLDGVQRLGVLEIVAPAITPALEQEMIILAGLVAELIVVNDAYTDLFARVRRRNPLTLAAEIQWELLPPLTFASDRVVISGALEPVYEIGGDTFDYAVNGSTVDLMILDAIGHGLPAAVLASVAIGAYRHARRSMRDLPEISTAINDALAGQFPAGHFATAAIARLNLDSGQLRWVNAGHPAPLIVRDGSLLHPPPCPAHPPLGLQTSTPTSCDLQLQPGDRIVFYTDGITEARARDGEFFGDRRLADFIIRATAAGDAAPETLRRLMHAVLAHQSGRLQDDASIIVLEWHTTGPARMQVESQLES